MNLKNLMVSKELKNAGWLIIGRLLQMILALVVGLITARYLGPNNYGLVNYATAYVAFFTALCTLGINSIIIKDFVDHPDEQGKAIGTAIGLRFISSILSTILIIIVVSVVDKGEPLTVLVVGLSSTSLIFQIFDTINYWFQYQYKSKVTSLVTLIGYFVTSIYRIILLVLGKSVVWFAFASALDYIVVAILLLITYEKSNGPKFVFSFEKGINLLSRSYHYILSGMMVAIYQQTDKLMLKQLLNETEVGFYSAATTICNMWPFILVAIIDSMYPTIMQLHTKDIRSFEKKNKQLYCMVFYISMIVSIVIVILADWAVPLFYGSKYKAAIVPLKIITWYTAFSYLGVARNAWIVCENKQKYLKYMYFSAAIINIFLNWVFIPILGASGAALASLFTQICTSIILPWIFRPMRKNCILMLEAIAFKGVLWDK